MTSSRPLLVIGVSTAGCQFGGLRLGVDSSTKPVDGNGQETVSVVLLSEVARLGLAETQVFSSTVATAPPLFRLIPTNKSGFPSLLKSPTATCAEVDRQS